MALSKTRLKNKIIEAFHNEQTEEQDHEAALDRIADKLASCLIDEIKELKINYTGGLTAPNGPVNGTFNATIT
ncbi:hypothetical protein [Sphingobacterium siyangense]|uniref:hypothetical protein n=1 Tax=Sphingobacterium TaxID=28453 RepID=UPI00301A2029